VGGWERLAAHAQLKVRYPIVDYREVEVNPSHITFDKPKAIKQQPAIHH